MAIRTMARQRINRLILGLFGIIFILLAAGVLSLGLRQEPVGAIGYIVAVAVAVSFLAAGLHQMHGALAGRLPQWYAECLLFVAGVLATGGPDRK